MIKTGEANYIKVDDKGRNRWGDYSGISLDPSDNSKIWMCSEYAESPSNTWGTWIAQTSFSQQTITTILTIASSNPNSGVSITVSPNDNSGQGNGSTQFTRTYNNNISVTLTAPSTSSGNSFQKWQKDGADYSTNQSVTFSMDANHTMTAVYITPAATRTLTIASSNPNSGINITVSPNDNNGQGNGSTQFTRTYSNNTSVTLTAPSTASGNSFQKWQKDGVDFSTNQSVTFSMDANHTMTAIYSSPNVTWQASLSISDNCSGSGTLTFGEAPGATDGIDVSLGESELPPAPPSGTFDSRFNLPVTPAVASLKDYRADTQTQAAWHLTFQPGSCNYPINFTWNPSNLPTGNFNLKDEISGSIVNVNMKNQSSYSLTNTGITGLKIEYSQSTIKDIAVQSGWNIISIPLSAADMSVSSIFPDAASSAYKYNNAYQTITSFSNGVGYWLKFNTGKTYTIQGSSVSSKIVNVNAGWNIIGPFENDISTTSITSSPAGIISTPFYGFGSSYITATTLQSGKGYWVKVSNSGTLNLSSGTAKIASAYTQDVEVINKSWVKIFIKDALDRSGTIYLSDSGIDDKHELPPIPPSGIFDVRFNNNKNAASILNEGNEIEIRSATYPITLSINNPTKNIIKVSDLLGGEIINTSLVDGKKITIEKPIEKLKVKVDKIPDNYEVSQNYPNPFNPSTTIKISLPKSSNVKITLYDILGNELRNIVNKYYEAGNYQIEFDASKYSSGIYIYRFQVNNLNIIKKMIIMK